jgi:MinD superfamily P-loop ATPase
MKEIVVLSGKGGTGKTSIVGSFAVLSQNKVLADCDVDAADLHILLNPSLQQETRFWSGQKATIDIDICNQCGLCQDICHYNAIKDFTVSHISCEGCGFCYHVCPVNAITMEDNLAGDWYISDTRYGPLVHAKLGIAQENSGKLVAVVRQTARQIAREKNCDLIITDGPPGIGCPVISSLTGASLALLITEPTLSGIHDLERVVGVCRHFSVPAVVCINKYDINEENSRNIEKYCSSNEIEVLSKIHFDNVFTDAIQHGLPVVEYSSNGAAREIELLWERIIKLISV